MIESMFLVLLFLATYARELLIGLLILLVFLLVAIAVLVETAQLNLRRVDGKTNKSN